MTLMNVQPQGVYVDGTLGTGGHALGILSRLTPEGRLVGLDRDPQALEVAGKRLAPSTPQCRLVQGRFSELKNHLDDLKISTVQGILLDLGLSTLQLSDRSGRGFSFQRDEPLDMRMDPRIPVTAADLANRLPYRELKGILREYGEELRAAMIAREIVRTRERRPLESTRDLVEAIEKVSPRKGKTRIHPATRTFQALRIAVNRELEELSGFLKDQWEVLASGGRLIIISYHSLEDRLVKDRFRELTHPCTCPPKLPLCQCGREARIRVLTKRAVRPSPEEMERNPRARSARLRAAEKI
jgi:16S rRNA (cytosine1402-N4)-methyltransferase